MKRARVRLERALRLHLRDECEVKLWGIEAQPCQEPDYGALAGITADDWAVMISGGDPTEAAMGQQLARQARTIRRLRALADGYRARWTHAIQVKEQIRTFDEMHGAAKERARIVAALRENGGLGDMPNFTLRLDYACNVIADAIERGEL